MVLAQSVAAQGFCIARNASAEQLLRCPSARLPETRLIARDRGDAGLNTYSGTFGWDAFPPHTDMAHWLIPPRFICLTCEASDIPVEIGVIDAAELISAFGERQLARILLLPRRPVHGQRHLLTIWERTPHGGGRFRWDGLFLIPASRASSVLFNAIKQTLKEVQGRLITLTPGDSLILDNWRVLHFRPALAGPCRREVRRVYASEVI